MTDECQQLHAQNEWLRTLLARATTYVEYANEPRAWELFDEIALSLALAKPETR